MKPGDHGSTFAGNPLVCLTACTVFDIISQPDFLALVEAKGQPLWAGEVLGLCTLGSNSPWLRWGPPSRPHGGTWVYLGASSWPHVGTPGCAHWG